MIRVSQPTWIAISGAFGGIFSAVVNAPLDVVKTRLQVQGKHEVVKMPVFRGTFNSMRKIVTEEGFRGLYTGLNANIIGLPSSWAVYFTTYEKVKAMMALNESRLVDFQGRFVWSNLARVSLCAIIAGATSSTITQPIWVARTRIQTARLTGMSYSSVWGCIMHVYRTSGLKALYAGLIPSLFGLTHVAIQFPIYEWTKYHWARWKRDTSSPAIAVCSAVSKLIASTITYPHEVIRSRLQDGESGMMKLVIKVYNTEGVSGFYRGLGTNMLRAIPSCVCTFTVYEFMNKLYKSSNFQQLYTPPSASVTQIKRV